MNANPSLTVAVVHGIGVNTPGYAAPLIAGITREFYRSLREAGQTAPEQSPLRFIEIVWDDIVAEQQAQLSQRLRKSIASFREPGFWARLAAPLLRPLKKGADWVRTDFAAEYVSDILAYRNPAIYARIQQRITDELDRDAPASGKSPLTFVAHSLGTVITSDFIYDRTKQDGALHSAYALHNLVTMGSPLAVFALRYGGADDFASPVQMEDPAGRWINILDRDDPIAYPLKPLNAAYDRAVEKDVEVDTGLFGIAHVKYWKNRSTQRLIAAKLAADYLSGR